MASETVSSVKAGLRLTTVAQLKVMAVAFRRTPVRSRVLLSAGTVFVLILLTTYSQYRLNRWTAPFYDALERRDVDTLLVQLKAFAFIAASLIVLNVAQAWYNQVTALAMREGLSSTMMDEWLKPGRAIRLARYGTLATNPDQRLHEDARSLAENTTSLAIGLVNSTILLASFVGVLWTVSQPFSIDIFGARVVVHGYLVWAAIGYASIASLLSAIVGRSLPTLNAQRYALEAELRYSLVNASEQIVLIGIARGEENERRRLNRALSAVLLTLRQVIVASTNLTWVSAGFGWMFQIVPILVAAPMYLQGKISFGVLMMAVGAFIQVNAALRWYVDNIRGIADWQATLMRVSTFLHALSQSDAPANGKNEGNQESGTSLVLNNVELRPTPETRSRGLRLPGETVMPPGQKVMISADGDADLHLLFKAMASDLKPAAGKISLPAGSSISYMPQVGYFPISTLAELLTYPLEPGDRDRGSLSEALRAAGAAHLVAQLERQAKWANELDREDAVRVRVANSLVAKPDWLIIDDVVEGLEPEAQAELCRVFASMDCGIVYVGNSETFAEIVRPRTLKAQELDERPHLAPK